MKNPNPLVSVVVSTYNRADLLYETIQSILNQTYKKIEVIVVDDGSTDTTKKIVNSFEDYRIQYIYSENWGGPAKPRNIGIKRAKGEYIAFQDDDDLMVPDRIHLLLKALCVNPDAVLALGDYAFIDQSGNPTGEKSKFLLHEDSTDPITAPVLLKDGYLSVLWPKVTPLPHTTLFRKSDAEKMNS